MSSSEYESWRDAHTWDPSRDSSLVVESDLTPAEWIAPLLVPRSFEVRMTVPQGFEAYVRIFFPFVGERVVVDGEVDNEHLTWTEVARRRGRVAHALMEEETIQQTGDGRSMQGTCYGSLVAEQVEAILPVLIRHTSSSGGWFLLWDGWGDLNDRVFGPGTPKVRHAMRDLYLLRGALSALGELPNDPNYFWPDDRAWCLCTDTDFDWAYLAGSTACIEEVLAVAVLDAYATTPENPARVGMDVVNDPHGTVPRR
jgi:hypothetical protein